MNIINSGSHHLQSVNASNPLAHEINVGSWTDWALSLSRNEQIGESGTVIRLAEQLAGQAAISTESAVGLLLWLGSTAMLHHTRLHWPSGIWQPGGLMISLVEGDGVPIDSVTNAFIKLTQNIGLDPIHDTVKEGPAGLISRLEHAGSIRQKRDGITVDNLAALAAIDTESIAEVKNSNRGNSRALIYPSGRALLSYLYDTPFFNTIDELIQHGNLNVKGKSSSHRLSEVHVSMIASFYQGALVTLTNSNQVQNNMVALMRQMMVFWPTSGAKRHTNQGRIDIALHRIERLATEGLMTLETLSDGVIELPQLPAIHDESMLPSGAGVGVRYTVLNRAVRINKLALAVAFWRIATGGRFEITKGDLAIAESVLHLHEMGGRLFEHVMAKGRLGHEFMRIFVALLEGDELDQVSQLAEDISHASELGIGAAAVARLSELSIINNKNKLNDEYRFVTGDTVHEHRKRWRL